MDQDKKEAVEDKALVKAQNYRFWETCESKAVIIYDPPLLVDLETCKSLKYKCTICSESIDLPKRVPQSLRCGHYVHFECLNKMKLIGCGHCKLMFGVAYSPKIDELALYIYTKGPWYDTGLRYAT